MDKKELIALGLSEEQAAKIAEMHKAEILAKQTGDADQLKKLKAEKMAAEKAAKDAEKVAQEKEEARLKAAGDLEGLKSYYDQQAAELKVRLEQEVKAAKDSLILRDKAIAKTKIMGDIDPRFAGFVEKMLDDAITVEHDENGAARYNIKLGDTSFTNEREFLAAAKNDQTWRNVLKAGESTGGGAGSTSTPQSGDPDSAFDARLRAAGLI